MQRAPQANKPQPAAQRQQDAGRGAGPQHNYRRGDRLPPDQRTRHAVVDNWRAYHLSAPPRGHQWVQVGSDFVLIAVASGIITQLVLSNR
ncbi:hypothetical protein D8I35_16625 [Corticibacter populi]|uniref:RcnB family protein n=1 Tax=Corticibacter populi TaxID=1550736 RepID=A0A3M6QKS2_9BURK|nr:hypothetical protein D8I35_16625 [Corticibacter populi]